MTRSRLTKITVRTAALGALLAGFGSLALAQKVKPPVGPPSTTTGTVQSSPKAEKGQTNAEAKRTDAQDKKALKNADKLQNKEQGAALKSARNEPKALLKGIKLTSTEKASTKAIETRYAGELQEIEKQARIAEKAGQADPSVASRIDALRARERTELRNGLTPAQQTRFDKNAAAYGTKKP
jgi:hypothetical protein